MDFDHYWNQLLNEKQLRLETKEGSTFTARFSQSSITIEVATRGRDRRIAKDRFEEWFHTWFDKGERSADAYRNVTGKQSKAGNFSYARSIFQHLEKATSDVD